MRISMLTILVGLTSVLFADAVQDKLSVARYLVESLRRSPEAIDHFDAGTNCLVEVAYPTYDSLFEQAIPQGCVGSSWSVQERKDAFEYFVRNIPALSRSGEFPGLGSLGDAALGFCLECNVSNSLELAMSVLNCPDNPCVDAAINLFEQSVVPSNEISSFVCQCVTNESMSVIDGDYLASGYVSELKSRRAVLSLDVLTNGVAMAMRLPLRCQTSRQIDLLLLDQYPSYGQSSNRLELSCRALNYINEQAPFGGEKVRQHFESVTNQLMNAAQPLPEVEALRGL